MSDFGPGAGGREVRYFTRVHASNRHAGYGEPVEVLASSRQEAISRAISLGWSGRREDARVTIDKVVDEAAAPASTEAQVRRETAKAVLAAVRDRFTPTGERDELLDEIAREFGVTS